MEKNNQTTQSNEGRSPDVGTSVWFAVYPCGWKLDMGTRENEEPVALFKFRSSADEYAKGWPETGEVRPHYLSFANK
jgi:hypothetical protein